MRQPATFVLAVLTAVLLVAGILLYQKYRRTEAAYTATKAAEETVRGQYSEAITAIAEIQDNLNAIDLEETDVRLLSQDIEADSRVTQSRKDQIKERIEDLNASVQQSKERIRQLETTLKESRLKIAGLEKMIESLKMTVANKEARIGRLTAKVDSLSTRVVSLEAETRRAQETISEQQQTIEDKRREMETIYYIVGSRKDLKKLGIIEETGGVLGMGKSVQLASNFSRGYFTPLDTQEEQMIPTRAARIRVLSGQARTSYDIRVAGDYAAVFITNPREFCKVKYVVVMMEE